MMSVCEDCGFAHQFDEPCVESTPEKHVDMGEVSDGYHTFNELYAHRHALFIALCHSNRLTAWRSKWHDDGTGLEGWFIAGLRTLAGPISYHLPISYWDRLAFAITLDLAPEWDGHTSADVVERLLKSVEPVVASGECGVMQGPPPPTPAPSGEGS